MNPRNHQIDDQLLHTYYMDFANVGCRVSNTSKQTITIFAIFVKSWISEFGNSWIRETISDESNTY